MLATVAETTLATSVEALRAEQALTRYPILLGGSTNTDALYQRVRAGTGLSVVALRHASLSPAQAEALAEFRMQQYVLWGWYDLRALSRNGSYIDPAFERLPSNAVHVMAGTADGCLLAYFCMQPAAVMSAAHALVNSQAGDGWLPDLHATTMSDRSRPRFPTEIHSFSPDVFSTLPALAHTPVARVRELTRLLRNQAVYSRLGALAVVEAVSAMIQLVLDPEHEIEAMLGCVDLEARRVTRHLGIPILYAPLAPTLPLPEDEHEFYWAWRANEQGQFWPFVIATEDLRPTSAQFAHLDALLDGQPREIWRGLLTLRQAFSAARPHWLARDVETAPFYWTDDANFEQREADAEPVELRRAAPTTGQPLGAPRAASPSEPTVEISAPARTRSASRRQRRSPGGKGHHGNRRRRAKRKQPAARASNQPAARASKRQATGASKRKRR